MYSVEIHEGDATTRHDSQVVESDVGLDDRKQYLLRDGRRKIEEDQFVVRRVVVDSSLRMTLTKHNARQQHDPRSPPSLEHGFLHRTGMCA